MKKSLFFSLFLLLLYAGMMWGQAPGSIPLLIIENDSIDKPTSVIPLPYPTASLNGTELTIVFSSSTASQIIIMNQGQINQTVYFGNFFPTTQVVIDLDDEGIGEGSYLLRIYAFGKWWWGEFVLEE
ncbi:MAG: DUF3244 domain-containing protein [Bacteroidaceae bacterium]|nr:DUF3244 domain-containing protein [Bacteroidaceae bacterium]